MKSVMATFIGLTLVLSAPAQAQQTPGGGVFIGNGGDIYITTASIDHLRSLLLDSKMAVRQWILQRSESFQMVFFAGAFVSSPSVVSTFDQMSVLFMESDGCLSNRGHTDASTLPTTLPAICISGRNLSQKVPQSLARPVLESLILHEFAHLVGADERKARMLQIIYYHQRLQTMNNGQR